MRSISRRAGWSTVAKKSGSPTATRSTGICSRANQTRTAAGMRSSVRMLWNSSATISIVARSTGVRRRLLQRLLALAAAPRSSAGVLTGPARRARVLGRGQALRDALLRLVDRRAQARRQPAPAALLRDGEVRQLAADQAVQPAEHRLGMLAAARQAAGARHQARLFADAVGRRRLAAPRADAGRRRRCRAAVPACRRRRAGGHRRGRRASAG